MDDDSKALIEAVAGAALRPVTKLVDDAIGVLGGDALEALRERQRARRAARNAETITQAAKLLRSRAIEQPTQPNEAAVEDLLEAAQDEPREGLRKLWAHLLAAMFDPTRSPSFRREFIDIAKQLEPLDCAALPILAERSDLAPSREEFVAGFLKVSTDQVELSFRNLMRLQLAEAKIGTGPQQRPSLSTLGRQFLAAVQ